MGRWKSIPGYPGYWASAQGQVLGKKGGVLKPKLKKYAYVDLYRNNKRARRPIHQLVLEVFGPPRPSPNHFPNHKDGNKLNNSISNLEWLTPKENMRHAVKTGLFVIPSGPKNHWHGKAQSASHILKRSEAMRGKKNHQYKHGRYSAYE